MNKMDTNNLDVQLYNDLDESVLNAIGMTDNFEYSSNFCCGADGDFSNSDGGTAQGPRVSSENIQSALQIGSALVQAGQQSRAAKVAAGIPTRREIKARCGRKPVLPGKRKRQWKQCRDGFVAERAKAATGAGTTPPPPPPPPPADDAARSGQEGGGTFLGMPKGVGIAVAVLGGLALVAGSIYLVRRIKK